MSANCEEDSSFLNSEELVYLLAIAGRIDAQSRLLAQKLDENRYIYHAYAVADSLSSSYIMFKFFMEVVVRNTDPDYLHNVLTSPEGIAAISAEAIFLVSFSFLASVFEKEENDSVKKLIASAWPYFRDLMKGLKNAYKGWRSTVQVLGQIGGIDLKYMIIPVGLGLGVFAAANRLWIRSMQEQRKKQMNINKERLAEINQLTSLGPDDPAAYLSSLEKQTYKNKVYAFLAVGAGGLLDGLYLYIGVGSLAILSPPLLIAMSVLGAVYTLACIITRLYEEYDFQLRFEITRTKCKLALTSKELEFTYNKLLGLQENKNLQPKDLLEIQRLKQETIRLIQDFEKKRQKLKEQSTYSYFTAGLLGMKYGLYAYGVLTSILFTVSTVCLITSAVFPPALLAAFIISGLVLMFGMTAYMSHSHYQHMQKRHEENEKEHPYDRILEMKNHLMEEGNQTLSAKEFKESLTDGHKLDPSPQTFFQEWLEVFRCYASGLSKGNNFSDFALTPLQEIDSEGHFQKIPIMGVMAIACGTLFSSIFGFRALARGFGRTPQGQSSSPKAKEKERGDESEKIDTQPSRESSAPRSKAPDSLPRASSFFSSFFYTKPPSQDSTRTQSVSDINPNQSPTSSEMHTIQGLE